MGYVTTRQAIRVKGGAHFAGTVGIVGASTLTGAVTVNGAMTAGSTVNMSGATAVYMPYHTVSPNVDTNGQIAVLQKGNRSYLLYQAGGTPCYITLPQVTAGTALYTVGGTP